VTRDDDILPDDETWLTADEAVTPDEQRRGRSLDERLDEETRDDETAGPERAVGDLVEEDRPDTEAELVSALTPHSDRADDAGEITDESVEDAGWDQGVEEDAPSAEELAVTVRDEAPGGTDDESDDYVADDEGAA
jgi:hypothetical protein